MRMSRPPGAVVPRINKQTGELISMVMKMTLLVVTLLILVVVVVVVSAAVVIIIIQFTAEH